MRIDKFTTKFQQALADAESLASQNENPYVEALHLLIVLLNDKENNSRDLLERSGVFLKKLINDTNNALKNLPKIQNGNNVQIGQELQALLLQTEKEALKRGDSYISIELFLFILTKHKGQCGQILSDSGLNRQSFEMALDFVRGGENISTVESDSNRNALSKFTVDLTEQAKQGKLDPVIGRDDEIRRTIQILQRRTKNNPVLIGEPGVGKTAIAEGLAQRILNQEVPETLSGKRILSLDLAALLAGAKFRGEFEERLKSVLKEIARNEKNIIFIDELHTIVGAGRVEGAMDAGNMLKPMLARGELHCIGATTLDEYKKYIEKDAAFERRFQKVFVNEPDLESTVAILRGLQERYEIHHGVKITDPAIISAAELSQRYITDRFLPDKAIDLIDEAAARIRMEIDSKPEVMDKLERRIIQLKIEREAVKRETDEASKRRFVTIEEELNKLQAEFENFEKIWKEEKSAVQGIQSIKEEIDNVRAEMANLQREGQFNKLAELQYGKLPELESKLKISEDENDLKLGVVNKPRLLRTEVDSEEIATIVSRATGIPVTKIMQGEREKLLGMEEFLHKRIVAQNEAVHLVSDAIRRSRAGLSEFSRPYGSFLFLGPTGVGKTELTKALAEFMFDSEEHIIRIDMSEFMEKHSVARLIGAPPGYVGYEEGGFLTESVRRKPYSVILLDEIEKAHPDVFNILLQVLDDGKLTDGHGRKVNFRNTVIVMTSNLGSQHIQTMTGGSYEVIKKIVWEELKQTFRPEFLNRIDEIVIFHNLDSSQIGSITRIQLGLLGNRIQKKEMRLEVSEEAIAELARAGFDPVFGARPLKRTIQQSIENPLARLILQGNFKEGDVVPVDWKNGKFVFTRTLQ